MYHSKPPCESKCAGRSPSCHCTCDKYIKWKEDEEEIKARIMKKKKEEEIATDMYIRSLTFRRK